MRKTWFILCMMFVLSFGVTACVQSEEARSKIDILLERQEADAKKLVEAYEKYRTGELTTGELGVLKDSIQANIRDTRAEVLKLKESGVGWWELIGTALISLISRGVPSKGPLSSLFGMFTKRRTGS